MIAVHVVLGIFYFINKLNSSGFILNVGIVLLEVIVFLLFVGIFEEGLFRGLILNAFLAKSGGSFKGVLNAVFLSSLLFGIAHVVPDIFNLFSKPETNSLFTYIQIIEKILQTGIIGFVLAVIYIGNHNFWSIALIHAFDDFGSAGVNFLFQNSQNVNYVNTTSGGLNSIAYLVLIVLLLPAAIYAYFQLKKISLPQFGFFEEPWKPREVKKIKVDK